MGHPTDFPFSGTPSHPLGRETFLSGQIDFCSRQIVGIQQKRGGGQSEYAAEEMRKCRQNWEGLCSSGAKAARLAEEYTHSEVHSGGDGQQGLKFV